MLGSEILDVAIGLVFVYLILSLVCSSVREGIESWMKSRSRELLVGISELLADPDGNALTKELYEHPLVHGLFAGSYEKAREWKLRWGARYQLPSYIPARSFALAVLDLAGRGPAKAAGATSNALTAARIRATVAKLRNPVVERAVLVALDTAQDDVEKAIKGIETWYDGAMDRVSGVYKRKTQVILFVIALVTAVLANADTLAIFRALYDNDAVRDAVVARAGATVDTVSADEDQGEAALRSTLGADLEQATTTLQDLDLPIGWSLSSGASVPELWCEWQRAFRTQAPGSLLGWLLTAFALTLGAPFWFDVLNKFMVVRSTVKPHEKSPEEGSEDRQPKNPPRPVDS